MRRLVLGAALALLTLACSGERARMTPGDLMSLELEFAESVAQGDVERFRAFLSDDATFLAGDGTRREGREEIVAAWSPLLERPETQMSWKPIRAVLSDDASMGFTYGDWKMTRREGDGSELLGTGRYASVWRREEDGVWRVALDVGNKDETPRVEISF